MKILANRTISLRLVMNREGEMGFKVYELDMRFLDLELSKTLGSPRTQKLRPQLFI